MRFFCSVNISLYLNVAKTNDCDWLLLQFIPLLSGKIFRLPHEHFDGKGKLK